MKTIEEMTDQILKQMKPSEDWDWSQWWERIVNDGPVPGKNSLKYKEFVERRLRIKNQINRELAHRNLPERLICKGWGKSIYLEDKSRITRTYIDDRSRKLANSFTTSILILDQLSRATALPDDDSKLLRRIVDAFEFNKSALAGTFARMRSLTASTKKEILGAFGAKILP